MWGRAGFQRRPKCVCVCDKGETALWEGVESGMTGSMNGAGVENAESEMFCVRGCFHDCGRGSSSSHNSYHPPLSYQALTRELSHLPPPLSHPRQLYPQDGQRPFRFPPYTHPAYPSRLSKQSDRSNLLNESDQASRNLSDSFSEASMTASLTTHRGSRGDDGRLTANPAAQKQTSSRRSGRRKAEKKQDGEDGHENETWRSETGGRNKKHGTKTDGRPPTESPNFQTGQTPQTNDTHQIGHTPQTSNAPQVQAFLQAKSTPQVKAPPQLRAAARVQASTHARESSKAQGGSRTHSDLQNREKTSQVWGAAGPESAGGSAPSRPSLAERYLRPQRSRGLGQKLSRASRSGSTSPLVSTPESLSSSSSLSSRSRRLLHEHLKRDKTALAKALH